MTPRTAGAAPATGQIAIAFAPLSLTAALASRPPSPRHTT